MEAIECLKTRRSVRKYTDQEVERDVLNQIIETTSYAPSWKNTQIVRYIIVEDKEKISQIASLGVLGFAYNTKTMERSKVCCDKL